jgi:signal transduction histidine kinase
MLFRIRKYFQTLNWPLRVLAVLLILLSAHLITGGLWRLVDRPVTAPLFLAAIVVTAWLGGMLPAIIVSVLGGLMIDYYYIPPFYTFNGSIEELLRISVFISEGVILAYLTERLRIGAEELKDSREQLRQLSQYQQAVRENEQKRIAMEIHDELGQLLTRLKMDVYFLKQKVQQAAKPDFAQHCESDLEKIAENIDTTIATVRRIATELRPPVLDDFGLIAAVEWLANEFERNTRIKCRFFASDEQIDIDHQSSVAAFRIIQEALTNAARHSQATEVLVSVEKEDAILRIRVEDNGKGITEEEIFGSGKMGIIGMRERARLAGGTLRIMPGRTSGTIVEFEINDENKKQNTNKKS